jgi:hypothetical protein
VTYEVRLKKQLRMERIIQNSTIRWQHDIKVDRYRTDTWLIIQIISFYLREDTDFVGYKDQAMNAVSFRELVFLLRIVHKHAYVM